MEVKFGPLVLAAFAISFALHPAQAAPVTVKSNFIENFDPGSNNNDFGKLEFLGGLEMTSNEGTLGGWSSIRFRPDQKHFVGVLDTGDWVTGEITRDAEGRLSGVENADISPMLDNRGKVGSSKWRVDSESLALRNGEILVGFERNHRIDVYPDPGFETSKPVGSLNILVPKAVLSENRSIETVAISPAKGPLAGAPLSIMEDSRNKAGDLYAAVLDGPKKGVFYVKKVGPYAVTDGAFLPDGDLLILERRFGFTTGVGMRIRRISTGDIKPGATVDGEVLLEADTGYQIDNMEGLDVFQAADGSIHVILVSDDNFSLLQRSLMLEFKLN